MKKVFAIIALVAVMTSCKDKKKDEKKMDDTTTTTTPTDPTPMDPTTTTTTDSGVPKFADAEVQKYVDDYTAFVNSYVDAYKSKDMTKVQTLSTKATEWSSRSSSIAMKLSSNVDEATKFSNYMTKLSQDMTAAMTAK